MYKPDCSGLRIERTNEILAITGRRDKDNINMPSFSLFFKFSCLFLKILEI